MDEKDTKKVVGLNKLPLPADVVVALDVDGGRNRKNKYIVNWALKRFVPEGMVYFKLLHVRPVISMVQNHMGNLVHASRASNDEANIFRKQVEWKVAEKLLPYKNMCIQRKVDVEIIQIESDDVVTAIAGEILKHKINNLVIGASSSSIFSRGQPLSSKISEYSPTFCTVYAVSEGKFVSRPSNSETNRSMRDDSSETSCSSDPSSSNTFCSQTDGGSMSQFSLSRSSSSLPMQRFQALSAINRTLHRRMDLSGVMQTSNSSLDNIERNDMASLASSLCDSLEDIPLMDKASTSNSSSENKVNINHEQENLRVKIRHIQQLHAVTLLDTLDASRKIEELQKRHAEDAINLKQLSCQVEDAKILATQEKKRYEAAKREANFVKECAEREAAERKHAEAIVSRKTKENKNLENALTGNYLTFRNFTWEEIMSATSSFSEDLNIGAGACGTVYKCSFHHTTAAVKILHAKEAMRSKLFQQELEILSQIHHPHFLILLGACPEHACLVYEFMENGNLEDLLLRKNNTPALLWFDRFRIAWEVASALVFLHSSKPKAIIHRDLKPANILLNRNYVSKIGDVGLSTMIQNDTLSISTKYKDTDLVGTPCYIDPEYQRTGLVSPKSDVYAFGMVILQLLTSKPAMALVDKVEIALKKDLLKEVLDAEAGAWPVEETKELALMALKCIEFKGSDRPDLGNEVLPVLNKLKELAENYQSLASTAPAPPDHFKCPILKEVMGDPCAASDGHTYDRKAIEAWLEKNDTSYVTGLALSHKFLTPNYTLLSAIMDWKSRKY